jgi:hypothetical protein
MSEVDRLSNSGLYPALPIADKRGSKEDSGRRQRDEARAPGNGAPDRTSANPPDSPDPAAQPRPPKSLIDEYA